MQQDYPLVFDYITYSGLTSLGDQEIFIFKWLSSLEAYLQKCSKSELSPYKDSVLQNIVKILFTTEGIASIVEKADNNLSWLYPPSTDGRVNARYADFKIKPSRNIRLLSARSLIRLLELDDLRLLGDLLDFFQKCFSHKLEWFKNEFKAAAITCVGTFFEALGGIGGFRLLSYFNDFSMICLRIAKAPKEPVIVKTEAIRAIGSIIKGGGKTATDQTLNEVLKSLRALISHKSPLLSISAMKSMEHMVNYTNFFKSQNNLSLADSLLDGTLMKMTCTKVLSIRRALARLVSSLVLYNIPISDSSLWDVPSEINTQLQLDNKRASISLRVEGSVELEKTASEPNTNWTKKPVSFDESESAGNIGQIKAAQFQSSLTPDIDKQADDELKLKVSKNNALFSIKRSIELSRNKNLSMDFTDSKQTEIAGKQSINKVSGDMIVLFKNEGSLSNTLKKLSSFFIKQSCSREERAAICEIYAAIFAKMGTEYVEAHYPVIIFHILVDLVGSTQVKHSEADQKIIKLGLTSITGTSFNENTKKSGLDLSLQSTALAVRNIANWLLRVPLSQNLLSKKFKLNALQYLYDFWVCGSYSSFAYKMNYSSTNSFKSQRKLDYSKSKIYDSWDGIKFSQYKDILAIFKLSGEIGLLVVMQEWSALLQDLETEVTNLDIFSADVMRTNINQDLSENYGRSFNSTKKTAGMRGFTGFYEINNEASSYDISNECLISLVESNNEPIRMSAILCVTRYLTYSPCSIYVVSAYIFNRMCLYLQFVSTTIQAIELLNEGDAVSYLSDRKMLSSTGTNFIANTHTYSAAGAALKPLISDMNICIGYAQCLASVISNAISKNAFYAPLDLLKYIHEISLKILSDVYQVGNSQILHVDSFRDFTSSSAESNLKNNESQFPSENRNAFSRILSSDPLNFNHSAGLKFQNTNHIPLISRSFQPNQEGPINDVVVCSNSDDLLADKNNTPKKVIISHVTKVAYSNMKLNLGWVLASSFLSTVPRIFGLAWLKTQLNNNWFFIWKKALAETPQHTHSFYEPYRFGSVYGYQENLKIDLPNSKLSSCMPWADRAHLLQSKSYTILHLCSFLKLLVCLSSQRSSSVFADMMNEEKLNNIIQCLQNELSFTNALIDLQPPPTDALDFGAICGQSYAIVDDSHITQLKQAPPWNIHKKSSRNSDLSSNNLMWSKISLLGCDNPDLLLPVTSLPNPKPVVTLYFEVYQNILSSFTLLELSGRAPKALDTKVSVSLAMNILTNPENEYENYQKRQALSSSRAISRASSIKLRLVNADKNLTTKAKINEENSDQANKQTYLSGFRSGSWGYELEVGETSILRKIIEQSAIPSSNGSANRNLLSMAYGLSYGKDFNTNHFSSVEYGGSKLWCTDPTGYEDLIPVNQSNTPYLNPYTVLIDSSIQHLAISFLFQDESSQVHTLERFLNHMQMLPYNSHRQAAIMSNYLSFMLIALKKLSTTSKPSSQSLLAANHEPSYHSATTNKFFSLNVATFMADVACSALIIPSSSHRLLASEILGLVALCTDKAPEYLTFLIDRLTQQAIRSRDRFARAGTALALGSIFAHAGSITASIHLQKLVAMLHSLATDPDPLVHMWALRALSEAVTSAGFMFEKYGSDTLQMISKLLNSDSHSYPFVGESKLGDAIRHLPIYTVQNRTGLNLIRSKPHSASAAARNSLHPQSNNNLTASQGNARNQTTKFDSASDGAGTLVAFKEHAAFYHPNSLTHRYEPNSPSLNAALTGSSNFSMGLDSDWLRACCECDLDAFESKPVLCRLLNSLVMALGPGIHNNQSMVDLVLILTREFLRSSQDMGINISPIKANSGSLEHELLSVSSLYPDTKILSLTLSSRYAGSTNFNSDRAGGYPPSVYSHDESKQVFSLIPASFWVEGSYSRSISNPDTTTSVLAESIYSLHQQMIFIPTNFNSQYSSKLFAAFYLDQILEAQIRPIIRCTSTPDGFSDSYVVNGIRDLQITTVTALDSIVRLYGHTILENVSILSIPNVGRAIEVYEDGDVSHSIEAKAVSWLSTTFTKVSAMYPLLGWSWSDVLYEIIILHSVVQNSGQENVSNLTLSTNIESLLESIVTHVLNSEVDDISALYLALNASYGFTRPGTVNDTSQREKSFSACQSEGTNTMSNNSYKRLEVLVLIQLLMSIIVDKHSTALPKFGRKGLNTGQWLTERTDNYFEHDYEWFSTVDYKTKISFSNAQSLTGNQNSGTKKIQKGYNPSINISSQDTGKSHLRAIDFSTQKVVIGLIMKIISAVLDKHKANTELYTGPSKKKWSISIFHNLVGELITTAYSVIKTSQELETPLLSSGFELMDLLISVFSDAPDIAVLDKDFGKNRSHTQIETNIAPVLDLYEAQIKSSIMPLIMSLESNRLAEDKVYKTRIAVGEDANSFVHGSEVLRMRLLPKRPIQYVFGGLDLAINCMFSGVFVDSKTVKRILDTLSIFLPETLRLTQPSKSNIVETQIMTVYALYSVKFWCKLIKLTFHHRHNKLLYDNLVVSKEVLSYFELMLDNLLPIIIKTLVGVIADISTIQLFDSVLALKGTDHEVAKAISPSRLIDPESPEFFTLELFNMPNSVDFALSNLKLYYDSCFTLSVEALANLLTLDHKSADSSKKSGREPYTETGSGSNRAATDIFLSIIGCGEISGLFHNLAAENAVQNSNSDFSFQKILENQQTSNELKNTGSHSIRQKLPSKASIQILGSLIYVLGFKTSFKKLAKNVQSNLITGKNFSINHFVKTLPILGRHQDDSKSKQLRFNNQEKIKLDKNIGKIAENVNLNNEIIKIIRLIFDNFDELHLNILFEWNFFLPDYSLGHSTRIISMLMQDIFYPIIANHKQFLVPQLGIKVVPTDPVTQDDQESLSFLLEIIEITQSLFKVATACTTLKHDDKPSFLRKTLPTDSWFFNLHTPESSVNSTKKHRIRESNSFWTPHAIDLVDSLCEILESCYSIAKNNKNTSVNLRKSYDEIYASCFSLLLGLSKTSFKIHKNVGAEFEHGFSEKLFAFLTRNLFGTSFEMGPVIKLDFSDPCSNISVFDLNNYSDTRLLEDYTVNLIAPLYTEFQDCLLYYLDYLKKTQLNQSEKMVGNTVDKVVVDECGIQECAGSIFILFSSLLNKSLLNSTSQNSETYSSVSRVWMLVYKIFVSKPFWINPRSEKSKTDIGSSWDITLMWVTQLNNKISDSDVFSLGFLDMAALELIRAYVDSEFVKGLVSFENAELSDKAKLGIETIYTTSLKSLTSAINSLNLHALQSKQEFIIKNVYKFIDMLQNIIFAIMRLTYLHEDKRNNMVLTLLLVYLVNLDKIQRMGETVKENDSLKPRSPEVGAKMISEFKDAISKQILSVVINFGSEFRYATHAIINFSTDKNSSDNSDLPRSNGGLVFKKLLESILLSAASANKN